MDETCVPVTVCHLDGGDLKRTRPDCQPSPRSEAALCLPEGAGCVGSAAATSVQELASPAQPGVSLGPLQAAAGASRCQVWAPPPPSPRGRAPPGISATPGPASSVPRCSLQREHSELAWVTATKVFCVPRARGLSLHSRGVCHGRDVTGASPRRAPCPVRYTGPSRCPLHPRHAPRVCACSGPCVHACACVGV